MKRINPKITSTAVSCIVLFSLLGYSFFVVSEFNLFLIDTSKSNIHLAHFHNEDSSISVDCQIKLFNTPWTFECTPTNVNIQGGTFQSFTLAFVFSTLSVPSFFAVSEDVLLIGSSIEVNFTSIGLPQNITWSQPSSLNRYAYTIDFTFWATITYNETVEPFRSSLSVSTNTTIENQTYLIRNLDIWWFLSHLVIFVLFLLILIKVWIHPKQE